MRLWLDDLRPAPEGWTHVRTAEEAITHLSNGQFSEVSLDHDLGNEGVATGYVVASWIEEQAFFGNIPKLIWHIHSANPPGRARMEAALRSAERFWGRK